MDYITAPLFYCTGRSHCTSSDIRTELEEVCKDSVVLSRSSGFLMLQKILPGIPSSVHVHIVCLKEPFFPPNEINWILCQYT